MGKVWVSILSALAALTALAVATGATAGSARPTTAADVPTASDRALIRCGRERRIGLATFVTGPAASLGAQQSRWARFYVTRYNAQNRRKKVRLIVGDTQLPNTAQAVSVAQTFAGNQRILGVVGPGGSQEVRAVSSVFKNAGLAFVSGSSTGVVLTIGSEAAAERRGFFWRTVPRDDIQGATVASYMTRVLRVQRVFIIDDQETYGIGLANQVEGRLRRAGVRVTRDSVNPGTTTDFSSLIARIPGDTQIVYIPWQLPPKGEQFGRQMREQGKRATLFGSDGLFSPGDFTISGSYVSNFPINPRHSILRAFRRVRASGDFFGAPTYVAVQVVAEAIDRACRNGTATRAEVRRQLPRTRITTRASLLGLPIRFDRNGDIRGGRFGIYRIIRGIPQPVG
jgi:branched-chain amino acid transport system substrate-binding protein